MITPLKLHRLYRVHDRTLLVYPEGDWPQASTQVVPLRRGAIFLVLEQLEPEHLAAGGFGGDPLIHERVLILCGDQKQVLHYMAPHHMDEQIELLK